MLLLWLALALLLATIVAGTWLVVVRTRALFRGFREFSAAVGTALREVEDASERLAARSYDPAPLEARLRRVDASRVRLAVLLGAIGDVRASAGRVRALVPRK